MTRTLKIEKKYLVFRDQARAIFNQISDDKQKSLVLDFSQVIFFSRSFLDELLNIIEELKKQKKLVRIINLKSELKTFYNQVAKTKAKIKIELRQFKSPADI